MKKTSFQIEIYFQKSIFKSGNKFQIHFYYCCWDFISNWIHWKNSIQIWISFLKNHFKRQIWNSFWCYENSSVFFFFIIIFFFFSSSSLKRRNLFFIFLKRKETFNQKKRERERIIIIKQERKETSNKKKTKKKYYYKNKKEEKTPTKNKSRQNPNTTKIRIKVAGVTNLSTFFFLGWVCCCFFCGFWGFLGFQDVCYVGGSQNLCPVAAKKREKRLVSRDYPKPQVQSA